MIPTKYKHKISWRLSWPLGAEKISEAFDGLPQSLDFSLYFSGYNQSKVSTQGDIHVMSVEYSFSRPKSEVMINLGFGSPKWSITIYPIPRELKHRIKELLDQSFPKLRQWCVSHQDITGNVGCERITVVFNAATDELSFDEFSNIKPKPLKQKSV